MEQAVERHIVFFSLATLDQGQLLLSDSFATRKFLDNYLNWREHKKI